MTNHPRSPRAKFRVGEVVMMRTIPEFSVTHEWLPVMFCGDDNRGKPVVKAFSMPRFCSHYDDLRPLTKKEAGR